MIVAMTEASAAAAPVLPDEIANLQWLYRRVPEGLVSGDHYERVVSPLSTRLARGEVLLAARYVSVDPYMRINQARGATWMNPHPLDTVQSAAVVAQVLASSASGWQPGDWALSSLGWQTHGMAHAAELTKLDPAEAPVTTALGVLGMPGRTAWFGLTEAGRPHAGEVVVVSGAAGAVGSLVVQFAKRHGATVVGVAGGAAKCQWVVDALGADHALDYRAYPDADALRAALLQRVAGVDVYFDNVGGMVTDAVIPAIHRRARIVICGQISQYSGGLDAPGMGPRFLHHMLYQRATIQGVLARDYLHRMDEMRRVVAPWVRAGQVVAEETIIEGFDQLPAALGSMFTGDHRGKLIVKV